LSQPRQRERLQKGALASGKKRPPTPGQTYAPAKRQRLHEEQRLAGDARHEEQQPKGEGGVQDIEDEAQASSQGE